MAGYPGTRRILTTRRRIDAVCQCTLETRKHRMSQKKYPVRNVCSPMGGVRGGSTLFGLEHRKPVWGLYKVLAVISGAAFRRMHEGMHRAGAYGGSAMHGGGAYSTAFMHFRSGPRRIEGYRGFGSPPGRRRPRKRTESVHWRRWHGYLCITDAYCFSHATP